MNQELTKLILDDFIYCYTVPLEIKYLPNKNYSKHLVVEFKRKTLLNNLKYLFPHEIFDEVKVAVSPLIRKPYQLDHLVFSIIRQLLLQPSYTLYSFFALFHVTGPYGQWVLDKTEWNTKDIRSFMRMYEEYFKNIRYKFELDLLLRFKYACLPVFAKGIDLRRVQIFKDFRYPEIYSGIKSIIWYARYHPESVPELVREFSPSLGPCVDLLLNIHKDITKENDNG